jgi:hypothetical protein
MMEIVARKQAANSVVIVRLDRTIQYAAAFALKPRCLRLLDTRLRGYDGHGCADV